MDHLWPDFKILLEEIKRVMKIPITVSVILSFLCYFATVYAIDVTAPYFLKKGLSGKDLLKPKKPLIAESMGAVTGLVYFVAQFVFIPVPYLDWLVDESMTGFPYDKVLIL